LASSMDPGGADDLVQETWIAALRRPPARDQPVRPWLARVVRNAARMTLRGDRRRAARDAASETDRENESPSPEALTLRLEAQRRLADAVLALGQAERQVILLHYGEGLSSAEVGARLGIPAGTVRWRLREAIGELRRKLGVPEPKRLGVWAVLWKGV